MSRSWVEGGKGICNNIWFLGGQNACFVTSFLNESNETTVVWVRKWLSGQNGTSDSSLLLQNIKNSLFKNVCRFYELVVALQTHHENKLNQQFNPETWIIKLLWFSLFLQQQKNCNNKWLLRVISICKKYTKH